MPYRRQITMTAHWTLVVLLMLLISDAQAPFFFWAFGLMGLVMVGTALIDGLMNGPGPKLDGVFRMLHPWGSRAMYALLGICAVLSILGQLTGAQAWVPLKTWYLVLTAAMGFHAIFHLWRHTALGDGALRRMTPRRLYNIL